MLDISKILTIFLDDYSDFETVAKATELSTDYKNKIGIDYIDFMDLSEIQKLLQKLGYDLSEIKSAFKNKDLHYINFEFWN